MDETARDPRVSGDAAAEQAEDSRPQETTARTVARLLANPRRIRLP